MKKAAAWMLTIIGLTVFSLGSIAQTPESAAVSTETMHQELRVLQATMEDAINKGDIDALLSHVEDDVVFTTMNGDVAVGKDAIRAYFNKMMIGPDRKVDKVSADFIPEAKSILYGSEAAVAYGHTNDHYVLKSGTAFDVNARWSGTMLRRDGQWRVASFHYSSNMFDNPILSAQRRFLVTAGVIAAILLAGLGFWAGRRANRRNT